MFQSGDMVLYKDEPYEVIYVYSGTGYCEIRGKSNREQNLVSPHELVKGEKENKKNT